MRTTASLVILLLAGVAALSASASPSRAPYVTCGSVIVPTGSFSWRPERVVLGVVSLPPTHIAETAPTGRARWPYWSKAGIVIRANSPQVVVSVASRFRSEVAIGWGNVDAAARVRFAPCPPSSSLGEWNPYSGGFLLRSRSACVPLVFRVGERTATVRFGVGRRCG